MTVAQLLRSRAVRLMLCGMLVAGACLTGRAAYLHAKAALAGVLIREAWVESVRTGENRRPWPWADTHPVARLRIPRLGYDEIVLEGATLRTLAFGPARLRSGAAPGEPGNLVLAGHRTSWFRPLEALAPGDTIEVEWRDSRLGNPSAVDSRRGDSGAHPRRRDAHNSIGLRAHSYVVQAVYVVSPEDVSLLGPTPDDALTLVTCYPFGLGPISPQRFVVRATPLTAAALP